MAATGVGYAEGFAANSHSIHPAGWMPAVKYLVEELGADVNAKDHDGNTALHHAAARGDVEMILYLVSKGADVKAVNREGQTTADMANGPVQRTQPYPEARGAAREARREEQPQVCVLLITSCFDVVSGFSRTVITVRLKPDTTVRVKNALQRYRAARTVQHNPQSVPGERRPQIGHV